MKKILRKKKLVFIIFLYFQWCKGRNTAKPYKILTLFINLILISITEI